MKEQIYRRSMGLPYDQAMLQREISNYGVPEKAGGMKYDQFGNIVGPDDETEVNQEQNDDVPVEVRVEIISGQLLSLENEMNRTGALMRRELEPTMAEIDKLCAEFAEQLGDMELEDERFAEGVQEWAQNARHLFAEQRGNALSGDDQLLEDVGIYEAMVLELEGDNESRALIDIANTRRYQAIAQLSAAQIKELYDKAA